MIGQIIQNYQILEELGNGGFGAVYRAHEIGIDRDVAIKIILPQYANLPEFKQRFEIEAHVIARLEHPHIIPLYNYWQDETGAYLVMRYVRGGNLRDVLQQHGAIALNQIERILSQITDALSTTHEAGIIHRDLKPDNILIDKRGNTYLTDFGIAKELSNEQHITGTNTIVGTFAYAAPEQLRNDAINAQTDIYALGIMLYEMLTGEHPFSDISNAMLVMKQLEETLPSVKEKRSDLPGDLDDIIQKATAKSIEDRFETVQEFFQEFQKACQYSNLPFDQTTEKKKEIYSPSLARSQRSSKQERIRKHMLETVYTYWIEGILENSLNESLIQLDMLPDDTKVNRPWDVILNKSDTNNENSPEILSNISIIDIFDRSNGKLLILGHPGSGKTTFLLELTKVLLARANHDSEYPIPVIFNLSSWALMHKPLEKWLVDELVDQYHMPRSIAETWVERDQLLLLLDGLDEVYETQRRQCVNAINVYRKNHGFIDIVVCSRINEYELLTNQLMLNAAIRLQPLTDEQINAHLNKFGTKLSGLRQVLQKDKNLLEMSRSPFLLVMMITAYQNLGVGDIKYFDTEEQRQKHLFDTYTQRMLSHYPASAAYSSIQIRRYLHFIAKKLVGFSRTIFFVEAMQPIWVNDDSRMRIIRISNFILDTLVVLGILVLVISTVIFLAWILIPFDIFVLIWYFSYHIKSYGISLGYEPIFYLKRYSLWIPIFAFFLTLLLNSLLGAIVMAIATTVLLGLDISSEAYLKPRLKSGDALKQSIITVLKVSSLAAIVVGIAFGIVYAPALGIIMSIICFVFFAIMVANVRTIILHLILRFILMRRNEAPFNYETLLSDAVNLAILRRIGGGFIFIHRYLLEYFAALEVDET